MDFFNSKTVFKCLFLLFLFPFYGFSFSYVELKKRIHANLLIGDKEKACLEGKKAIEEYPDDFSLYESYLIALAEKGEQKEFWKIWKEGKEKFGQKMYGKKILEAVSWSLVQKGSLSSSPLVKTYGLLGAFFGQDIKGVEILAKSLEDDNIEIRLIALEIAGHLRDEKIKHKLQKILEKEKRKTIRLATIKAIGKMKAREFKEILENIVVDDKAFLEEKIQAISSLLNLMDTVDIDKYAMLAKSDRFLIRKMALALMVNSEKIENKELFFSLAEDPNAEVRLLALQTLGIIYSKEDQEKVEQAALKGLLDVYPEVALSSLWLLMRMKPMEPSYFEKWLKHPNEEIRSLAAKVLTSTGRTCIEFTQSLLGNHFDSFVNINLALGLLPLVEGEEKKQVAKVILDQLKQIQERIGWKQTGTFRYLQPLKKINSSSFVSPEETNQMTRLELFNTLALVDHSFAKEAFLSFLYEKGWGISTLAATFCLTEGDDTSISCVKEILLHEDKKLRLQAAFILAFWGREEESLKTLQEEYPGADRQTKQKIIEAIGKLGTDASLPFLIERMQEPFPTMQVIAAASTLECLNH